MKFPEFVGGFISGLSLLCIILGIAYLGKLQPDSSIDSSTLFLELLVPYTTAIIAGVGLGFGLKSEEGGFSFSFDFGEQWPTLVGAIALAAIFGLSVILFINKTPVLGLFLELIASLLAVFGLILVIFTWEASGY